MQPPLVVLICTGWLAAQESSANERDPARAFFAAGQVVRISITLADADRQLLRDKPREYVRATLQLDGKTDWRHLVCEFEVVEHQRDVELQLGLGAKAGTAWFRLDSLRLARVPD